LITRAPRITARRGAPLAQAEIAHDVVRLVRLRFEVAAVGLDLEGSARCETTARTLLAGLHLEATAHRIEILEEPERTFSSFVHGYTHMPVRVVRK